MEIFIIIVPCMLVLMIVMAIYSHKKEKERRERLQAFAAENRLYFHTEKVRGFDREHPEFEFLQRGSNRYAYNILTGSWQGQDVTVFDYHYETHSTDSDGKRQTHHHYFSAAILKAGFPLGAMTIRPEGLFDRFAAAFGWDDIDFESAEFSRRFHVSAQDRRWAYDILHPRTMEFLLENPNREIYFTHRALGLRSDHRLEPLEAEGLLRMGATLIDNIPEFARGA